MSGSSDINTMNSAYAKTSPGNFTNRDAAKLGQSLPVAIGGSTLAGSLSFMGKTSLFSRVALSPGAGNDKKGISRGAAPESTNDNETMASTHNAAT